MWCTFSKRFAESFIGADEEWSDGWSDILEPDQMDEEEWEDQEEEEILIEEKVYPNMNIWEEDPEYYKEIKGTLPDKMFAHQVQMLQPQTLHYQGHSITVC